METLPVEVLTSLLASADMRSLAVLRLDDVLKPLIDRVYISNDFWRQKVENLLARHVVGHFSDWKAIYDHLTSRPSSDWYVQAKDADVMEFLLSNVQVSQVGLDFAIMFASKGNDKVLRVLLEDGRANPAYEDNFAIRWAARQGYVDAVKLLLQDPRVNPSAANNDAIISASKNGHEEVVKLLLADPRINM